tara:strand:- start:254 stop:952 length:699 start_codon:yes stop_codon:yes gene_type:complete
VIELNIGKCVAFIGLSAVLLGLIACGAEDPRALPDSRTADNVIKSETPVPSEKDASKATLFPTPTQIPTPTHTPTIAPTFTPTPEPEKVVDEYGFTLRLDRGAYVNALPGNTNNSGIIHFEYGGANVVLSWVPSSETTVKGLISGTFDQLEKAQPDLKLDTVSESDLTVVLEKGLIIGFKSVDGSNEVVGGGLIGAWSCSDKGISYTIVVTGSDANVVQLRLNRLLDNFVCT